MVEGDLQAPGRSSTANANRSRPTSPSCSSSSLSADTWKSTRVEIKRLVQTLRPLQRVTITHPGPSPIAPEADNILIGSPQKRGAKTASNCGVQLRCGPPRHAAVSSLFGHPRLTGSRGSTLSTKGKSMSACLTPNTA